MAELEFCGNDPGAVKYGNFINYYNFHSPQLRINNLHPKMFPSIKENKDSFICLDIGCNSGELTTALYNYLEVQYPSYNIHILAIDIDATLIERAKEKCNINNITYMCSDITMKEAQEHLQSYLASVDANIFDVTFCFSVTMWIHLNNGDEGLLSFLNLIKCISDTVIIEPQPWKCYRNAQRRLKKSGNIFAMYHSLKITSNIDNEIVNYMNRANYSQIWESETSLWNRKVFSFRKF